jgi:PAB-dependent poly(A)-specific ribonuclease subunit 2
MCLTSNLKCEQDEVHDSVEDAKTALALYRHYQRLLLEGGQELMNRTIIQLYNYGERCNWTLGLDRES